MENIDIYFTPYQSVFTVELLCKKTPTNYIIYIFIYKVVIYKSNKSLSEEWSKREECWRHIALGNMLQKQDDAKRIIFKKKQKQKHMEHIFFGPK